MVASILTSMRFTFFLIFVIVCLFPGNYSENNVLCVFTGCAKPTLIVFMATANTLIERGHNVTIVTTIPIPPEILPKNEFRHIFLENPIKKIHELHQMHVDMYNESLSKTKGFSLFFVASNIFTLAQRDALRKEQFQKFLREDNNFDLLILGYFYNDFMVGLAARYQCPIAVVSLSAPFSTLNGWIGNPSGASYVQIPFIGRSHLMNFVERFQNFLLHAIEPLVQVYSDYVMDSVYRTLFTDESYPSYSDMISNISLVLYNRHFSEMPIRPLVPALIEIGGIQEQDQSDILPENIKDFLASSPNGAIFVRVGSIARNTELKPHQLQIILNVLSNLEERVVWEWERPENHPTGFPNILFCPSVWPSSILPHPNIKLYITDGRPLTVQESVYHGVPMVGLPLFAEEPYTIEEMTNSGHGVSLDVNTFTDETFKEAIMKVLESPQYTQKVQQFSKLFRDRPITARETAAFWLEYVIRHRGALHMQSPLVHMNFVKRWNIDVIVVLIGLLWVFVRLAHLLGFVGRMIVERRADKMMVNKLKQN